MSKDYNATLNLPSTDFAMRANLPKREPDMIKKKGIEKQFFIASAATSSEEIWGSVGNPVYPPARDELRKHGITCEGKRAVQVKKSDYDNYDYLICMDENNMRNIRRIISSDPENKIVKLLSFTNENRNVADPWYSGDFQATWDDIDRGITGLCRELGIN